APIGGDVGCADLMDELGEHGCPCPLRCPGWCPPGVRPGGGVPCPPGAVSAVSGGLPGGLVPDPGGELVDRAEHGVVPLHRLNPGRPGEGTGRVCRATPGTGGQCAARTAMLRWYHSPYTPPNQSSAVGAAICLQDPHHQFTEADASATVTTPPSRSPTPSQNYACEQSDAIAGSPDDLVAFYINNPAITEADLAGCPKYLPMWRKAQNGFRDGVYAVPAQVKPGTYETLTAQISRCYWERSRGGHIVDNNFVTASTVKQRVTIGHGDDTFVSRNCGGWIRVG